MAADLQFWLQVLNIGLAAALVVAGHRGYVVWRWHYNQMLSFLEQRFVEEHEARLKAERDAIVMRDLLFQALGVNQTVISKLDTMNDPIKATVSHPFGQFNPPILPAT